MSKLTRYVRHLAVVAIATLAAQCAWAAATPKLLINFGTTTETTGWVTHTQTSPNSGMIPKGGGYLEQNGVKFSTTSAGNFFDNNWTAPTTDLPTEGGTFVDIDGTEHASLVEEIETSLGLTTGTLTTDIYKTGLMNGGQSNHTATIAGLSAASKYVIYVGYGLKKNDDANQTSGIRISSSGYSSCGAREYVVTVAGTGTTVATKYQSFNEDTSIKPGSQGLMVVRLDDVVPTAAGEVKFTMYGDRAGINWLAVAEKNEKIPTADLTASGETSWTAVVNGADLTDKAVTLKLGGDTTITLDAAKPSMASFSVALADGVEAATLKFVAKSALWMPGAVGEGVTFTGLEINAETDQTVRTADLTIAANETVLVNGTTLGKVTNNGTFNVTGDSTFKLANNGTVNLLSGTSTISSDSQAIKGTINIAYGATYKCANNDQVPYGGSTTTTINVRGTLDMQNHRWTLGGADTINLYGGCTVSGQGDNDGLFDLYRDGNIINVQAGEGDQAEVKVVTLPAPIRARHTNGNIFIAQGMKLALTGGIKKADNNTSVVNMNGNGRLTGTVALKGGFTLNLGNAVGTIDAKFVAEGGTTVLKLGESADSTQITTSDSKDDPIVLVKSGATLDLYVKDFSSWNQAVTQYGWIKNEGTLNIYEYATTQSRYFRGHLVMKPGTTTTLNGTSQNFIVYGGNSDVTKAQMIVPASETATTTTFAGEGTIQLNVNGSGGTPGSAWDIGANSTLDVTAKVIGGEAIAKYGEGALKFSNTDNNYTGTITLKAGTIVVPAKLGDGKVVTDVAGMAVAFDEATLTYSLIPAEIAFTVTGLPEHAAMYVQINAGTITPIVNGQFTAVPGDKFVVWFAPAEGYVGNTLSTGVVTVVYPMQTTEIQSPSAEQMNIRKAVAYAFVGDPEDPEYVEFASLAEAIVATGAIQVGPLESISENVVIGEGVIMMMHAGKEGATLSPADATQFTVDVKGGLMIDGLTINGKIGLTTAASMVTVVDGTTAPAMETTVEGKKIVSDSTTIEGATIYKLVDDIPEVPTATVTELSKEVADAAGLDVAYAFTAGPAVEGFDDYSATFVVTFDKKVEGLSFELKGSYTAPWGEYDWTRIVSVDDIDVDSEMVLVPIGTVTYSDVLKIGTFKCGVANKSDDNIGTTMTVELILTDGAVKLPIAEQSYTLVAPKVTRPSEIEGGSAEQKEAYDKWAKGQKLSGLTEEQIIDRFIFNVGAETPEEDLEKALDEIIEKTDCFAKMMAEIAQGKEPDAFKLEAYPYATFQFCQYDDIETSAKLFRLKAMFVPGN